MMAIVITIIGIISGIASIAFFGIDKDVVGSATFILGFVFLGTILWFLFRPNVKEYFGRVKIQTT
jgi:hypothetical protein